MIKEGDKVKCIRQIASANLCANVDEFYKITRINGDIIRIADEYDRGVIMNLETFYETFDTIKRQRKMKLNKLNTKWKNKNVQK
jgi:hypothetical protein